MPVLWSLPELCMPKMWHPRKMVYSSVDAFCVKLEYVKLTKEK